MKTYHADRRRSGFSLIELMTVVMIIVILAAVVVPSLGVMTGAADKVKDKRNAQNIMLAYSTGMAAGVEWPVAQDVATQVAAVLAGQKPPSGPLVNMTFQSTVSAERAVGTYLYIGLGTDGILFFDSTGAQSATGH